MSEGADRDADQESKATMCISSKEFKPRTTQQQEQ